VIPRLAALLLFLLHPPCAYAAGDWDLKIDDKEADIRIFSRVNERGYPEFRGVTRVKSSLSGFVALFKDLDHMPNWAYRIRKAERLKVISEMESYAYTVNSMPPPLFDRDAVVHSMISQDAATLKMTFRGSGAPDFAPKNDRYVRMPVVESSWTFTPLGGGMVEVVFEGYGDPGGTLSSGLLAWFIRISLSEAPYQTMLQMKKFVTQPEYQAARYAYIREPGS
jgi:hypothetical protein